MSLTNKQKFSLFLDQISSIVEHIYKFMTEPKIKNSIIFQFESELNFIEQDLLNNSNEMSNNIKNIINLLQKLIFEKKFDDLKY